VTVSGKISGLPDVKVGIVALDEAALVVAVARLSGIFLVRMFVRIPGGAFAFGPGSVLLQNDQQKHYLHVRGIYTSDRAVQIVLDRETVPEFNAGVKSHGQLIKIQNRMTKSHYKIGSVNELLKSKIARRNRTTNSAV